MKIKISKGLTFPSAYRARPDYTYTADDETVTITDDMLTNNIAVIRVWNENDDTGMYKYFVNNTSTPLLVGISNNNTTVGTIYKSNFFGILVSPETTGIPYSPCSKIQLVPQGGTFEVNVESVSEEDNSNFKYAFCVSVGIPYFAKGEG